MFTPIVALTPSQKLSLSKKIKTHLVQLRFLISQEVPESFERQDALAIIEELDEMANAAIRCAPNKNHSGLEIAGGNNGTT